MNPDPISEIFMKALRIPAIKIMHTLPVSRVGLIGPFLDLSVAAVGGLISLPSSSNSSSYATLVSIF